MLTTFVASNYRVMANAETKDKKLKFMSLYMTGKYTQKEIAALIDVSEQSLVQWVKELPEVKYVKIRKNLVSALEELSQKPKGNEELIFKYITHIAKLDNMIRKSKMLPF